MKATLENPRGSVVKLSPKESVEGASTVLRGSVRAPERFSEGKPKAVPAAQCRHPRDCPERTIFPHCPEDFKQLLRLSNS